MIPNRFEYFCPDTLDEALGLLAEYQDDAKLLAGGQSLLSFMKLRLANPACLVDLRKIAGLSFIREDPTHSSIVIGAMTTHARIRESRLLQEQCPLLPRTTAVVGDVQVRNRGTLGGSLAHADPAGDLPAAILALDAEMKAVGPRGERWIAAADFFLGMYTTALEPDEILTEIRVPVLRDRRAAYLKSARRPSDFAIVGIAISVKDRSDGVCDRIAIGVTGLTDKPYRARTVEARLSGHPLTDDSIGAAAQDIAEGLEAAGNIHASPAFRLHLARVYLSRAIRAAN